jgi:hypothetical protein
MPTFEIIDHPMNILLQMQHFPRISFIDHGQFKGSNVIKIP